MKVLTEPSWKNILKDEFSQPYFVDLIKKIDQEYSVHTIYPPQKQIFKAFSLCPFTDIKVVMLGQDPYHGLGQAHGLAFSTPDGISIPPSLRNIYKEITSDLQIKTTLSGNLARLATQGVLLLNTTLTVEAGKAGSHQGQGWEEFTDAVIKNISAYTEHVVFLLWGAAAQSKHHFIDETKHLVLTAPHPSPLSAHRGFFGCRHFSKTNTYLEQNNRTPINW